MPVDEARLAVLEQRVLSAEADIRDLWVAIQGPPRDDSIRGRLHVLEQAEAAANAATAAVEAVKLVGRQRFTRGEKLFGIFVSLALVTLQTIGLIYAIQH